MWEKKDKHCDPDDPADVEQGSYWDHVIIDPETKLIVSLVVGRRNADTVVQVFTDFYERTGGYLPELIVTDEYASYETVILDTYGVLREDLELTPEEEEDFDRKERPPFYFPVEITYATVHKEKASGRVVEVNSRVVLGSRAGGANAGGVGTVADAQHQLRGALPRHAAAVQRAEEAEGLYVLQGAE